MEIIKKIYCWYAVYTRVNQEKKIHKQLVESGVESYLPLRKTLRQWSDRKVWAEEPFFRCYVFVHVSHVEYFKVLCTRGVINYVMLDGKAQCIRDQQMENIKTMINQRERGVVVSRENVEKGQIAKVVFGPFKGMEGEVIQVSSSYRILVRIDALGCNLYANIAKDEIEVVEVNPSSLKRKSQRVYSF